MNSKDKGGIKLPRKNDDNPTYDYNIYKIPVNRVDEFCEFLEERKYEEIPSMQQ